MPHTAHASPTIIVTGASSGIGRELSIAAARKGYAVVLLARRSDRLDAVATEIRAAGGTCTGVVADVTDASTPQRLLEAAHQYGRIDVIANIAGMGAPGTLLDQTDAAIALQWEVHVAAPLRIARAALPALIATHGQLLFIGSGLARVPAPGFGAYAPAKAAIRAAAQQLRRELHGDGVGVMYVDPGAVDTEFSEAAGMERMAGPGMLAKADVVAQRILHGIMRRAERVNAVPWQTAGVILGEWFPGLADAAMKRIIDSPAQTEVLRDARSLSRAGSRRAPQHDTSVASGTAEAKAPTGVTLRSESSERFEGPPPDLTTALEPVARRMERVKLTQSFVASLLVPSATLQLTDVAMRWAGMPNKNERAAMHEVLTTLAQAGFIEPLADETWRVLRGPV
ncbi:MAG: SDR family NAD(P)-dependent oxidoreductase [Candidatus Eremiobacteraeota bacterium]|nr:SDR family NAD(P)-dependent oxidoreductase [Candidatus Eremiobacteraeota bacterium]